MFQQLCTAFLKPKLMMSVKYEGVSHICKSTKIRCDTNSALLSCSSITLKSEMEIELDYGTFV